MRLPVEVSDAVIDQACDNPATLRGLSLTCRTFRPRSRYHLFTRIRIRSVEQMESSRDFLDEHPWLLPLVREVTLSPATPEDKSKRNVRVLDVVPVDLLTRLPNLCWWKMGPVYEYLPDDSTIRVQRPSHLALSLHRSAPSLYQRFSSHIHSLELQWIQFDCLSDFTRLISAFTSIHTLTCQNIQFRRSNLPEGPNPFSLYVGGAGMLAPHLQFSTLKIGSHFDIYALEHILARCGAALNSLSLDFWNYDFERFEKSITRWLSRLTSLTLVLMRLSVVDAQCLSENIRSATRILKSVGRTCLTDVQVEFYAHAPLVRLGVHLSGPDAPLDDCKLLDQTLLTFAKPHILVRESNSRRVTRRPELWPPIIEGAFPMLNKRGLLNIMRSNTDSRDPPGHELWITSLVASHDSRMIVTASKDGTIIIWDTSSGAVLQEWLACQHSVVALALSPDGLRLVSAGHSKMLALWAINNGVQRVAALEGHTDAVKTCAWSPDGTLIASASKDKTVRVWDGHTFLQRDLFLDDGTPKVLQCSPDSRYLAWISGNDCCIIWRPLTGGEPKRLRSHPDRSGVYTFALSFDPEGGRIATAHGTLAYHNNDSDSCVVRVWDVATGATLAVLTGYSHRVQDIAFSPDGRFLLSVSDDGSTMMRDVEPWKQIAVFRDSNEVYKYRKAVFSRDGKYIATGSYNRHHSEITQVQLWELGSGSCVAIFDGHRGSVSHLVFTPCGKFLASGDVSGIVQINSLFEFTGH